MTRHYGDRMIAVAVAVLGFGLIATSFAVWVQAGQIKQQRAGMSQLLAERAEDRQDAAELRSLVQALQQQVRDLGGQPLTAAPAPSRRPAQTGRSSAAPLPRATSGASRSPAPSSASPRPPRPTASPTRTPSPSPSGRVCVASICLPPGG